MILIKITKENREPEVGEWCKYFKIEDDWDLELNPGLKSLSLSVILDAPHWLLDLDWEKNYNKEAFQSYPISNSEEIFQWLHDHGKLGEEWVEWPYEFTHREGDVFCGEADKFYECVVCGSKCGSEGHYIFTEEVFLTGFPGEKLIGFDGKEIINKPNENPLNEQKGQNKKCICPTPLIRGVNPEYCGICEKDLESKKDKFISKVSKISETGEDEFKAEYNSPELIWDNVIKHMLGNGR